MSNNEWTLEEDDKLVELYEKYARLKKPLYLLAQKFDKRSLGSIEYRVKILKGEGRLKAYKDYLPLVPDEEQAKEEAEEDIRIRRARVEKKIANKKLNAVYDGRILQEALLEELEDFDIPVLEPFKSPNPGRAGSRKDTEPETDILDISDLHGGHVTKPDQAHGNSYNLINMAKRVEYLISYVKGLRQNQGTLADKLHVNLGGDIVSGVIHGLEAQSEGSIINNCFIIAAVLGKALRDLCSEYPTVDVMGVVGNHGRLNEGKDYQDRHVNFDYLVYHLARQFTKDQKNLNWYIPESHWVAYSIDGFYHLLVHGDEEKKGKDFSGLESSFEEYSSLLAGDGKVLSYMHISHFHDAASLPTRHGRIFLNGSIIGTDEYGHIRYRGSLIPCQWFLQSNQAQGVYSMNCVKLSEADELIENPAYLSQSGGTLQEELVSNGL